MKKPRQATFAESGFERRRKVTRREKFLAEMDQVVPWAQLCADVEPFYPRGRRAWGVRRWGWSGCCASTSFSTGFNLSDPAVEEALFDVLPGNLGGLELE